MNGNDGTERRHCRGKNKKGDACKAAPLKDSGWCSAHDPNRPDETRFGSPQQAGRAGSSPKPRTLRLMEVLAERALERIDEVVGAFFEGLTAERAVVGGSGESAELELVPDEALRLRAAEAIFDRLVGKPRQAVEHMSEGGGPVMHAAIPTDDERVAEVTAILAETPGALPAPTLNGSEPS